MNGCIYRTADNKCSLYTDEKNLSWCVIDGPCKDRKPSSGDMIRSMTDEQLAAWFAKLNGATPDGLVYQMWKEFLESEA